MSCAAREKTDLVGGLKSNSWQHSLQHDRARPGHLLQHLRRSDQRPSGVRSRDSSPQGIRILRVCRCARSSERYFSDERSGLQRTCPSREQRQQMSRELLEGQRRLCSGTPKKTMLTPILINYSFFV